MKLSFLSDIHLNFYGKSKDANYWNNVVFAKSLNNEKSDGLVIAGDIAEGVSLEYYLSILAEKYTKPIYYVHGNHDFYGKSFDEVKQISIDLNAKYSNLHWLQHKGVVKLTDKTCIVGHDGWYDGLNGDYFNYNFFLYDFDMIKDFIGLNKTERYYLMNELGVAFAEYIEDILPKAFNDFEEVIFVSHCPAISSLAKYGENATQINALPFFTCKQSEEAIKDIMNKHLNKKLILLSGHTHFKAKVDFGNIVGYNTFAQYGNPKEYMKLKVK